MDINELVSADIVLTTYDVLKDDLSHDSERHEGDRRILRYGKRFLLLDTFLLACILLVDYSSCSFFYVDIKRIVNYTLVKKKN